MKYNNYIVILPEEIEEGPETIEPIYPSKYLVIFLSKEGNNVLLDKYFYVNDTSEETIKRNQDGEYKIEVYSIKNKILESFNFNLSDEPFYEAIVIPNYLNIGRINIYKNGLLIDSLSDVLIYSFCNENNICEKGEENICPLDCPKSANNPNYPLFKREIQNLYETNKQKEILKITKQEPSSKYIPPKNYFYNLLISSILGLLLFLIIFFIIIKKFKK